LAVNQIAVRFDGAGTGEEYWITSYPKKCACCRKLFAVSSIAN